MQQTDRFVELGSSLIDSGFQISFIASGNSMDPTIHNGDRVIVQRVDLGQIKPLDVLLYRTARGPIVHRVIKKTRDGVLHLRGDAGPASAEPVHAENVIGKVTRVVRNQRTIRIDQNFLPFSIPFAVSALLKLQIVKRRFTTRLQNFLSRSVNVPGGPTWSPFESSR